MKYLLFPFLLAMMLISCDKDDNKSDDTDNDNTISYYNQTLEYDNSGKLISFSYKEDNNMSDFMNVKLEYSANKVIISGNIDNEYATQEYTLNDKGLATKCIETITSGTDKGDIDIFTFEYDSNGYLISCLQDNDDLTLFEIMDGNIVGFSDVDGKETHRYKVSYGTNYNNSKINIIDALWDSYSIMAARFAGILGRTTKNLPIYAKSLVAGEHDYEMMYKFNASNVVELYTVDEKTNNIVTDTDVFRIIYNLK
ncbi:MAG: DUF4595 domain-containing protein [Muribaculaceae bacterium]|nr:DUF4595 domain-containing protein [Muribaculaceae bacterium]